MKHFINLGNFTNIELRNILNNAKKIKSSPLKFSKSMANKSLGMIFEKQSTRTRVSFDIGMKKMGGNIIELDMNSIGFGTRESESDIIKVLSKYIDCLLIRNDNHKLIEYLANLNYLPLINGLSDYSHPCQILSDIFTIEEYKGAINKQSIAWVGDINNVSISLLEAAKILKFKLNIVSPKSIIKKNNIIVKKFKSKDIQFFDDPNKGISNADCIMTDVWISMGQKNSKKKLGLFKNFQVNQKLVQNAKKNYIFMHCLPAHRNLEVTDSIIDGKNSVVWSQSQNRMYVQQSILKYCIS